MILYQISIEYLSQCQPLKSLSHSKGKKTWQMVAVDAEKQETWMVFQIYFQLINYFLSLSASKMEEHPQSPDNVIAGFIHDQFFDTKGVKCGVPCCTTWKAKSFSIFTSSLTLKLCANKLRLWAMKAIQLYQLQNQLKKEITNKQRSISTRCCQLLSTICPLHTYGQIYFIFSNKNGQIL